MEVAVFGSKTTIVALFLVLLSASSGFARDDMAHFSIKEALDGDAKGKLEPDIRLSFGQRGHAGSRIGRWDSSKSSTLSDGPKVACHRSFFAAVVSLQRRAKKEGGNAVIDISSSYRNRETSSSSNTYVCSLGGHRAAVHLKGTVVRTGR
jgi:hypothetical protein